TGQRHGNPGRAHGEDLRPALPGGRREGRAVARARLGPRTEHREEHRRGARRGGFREQRGREGVDIFVYAADRGLEGSALELGVIHHVERPRDEMTKSAVYCDPELIATRW